MAVMLTRKKVQLAPMQGRPPESEVPEKAKRRSFSLEYKLRILEEADRITEPGGIGALLRREGFYSLYHFPFNASRDRDKRGQRGP